MRLDPLKNELPRLLNFDDFQPWELSWFWIDCAHGSLCDAKE